MTEATFIPNKSQPLIARNDYIENRSTYRILRRRLRYRNPYRKRRLNLRRRKPSKLILNKGLRPGRGKL